MEELTLEQKREAARRWLEALNEEVHKLVDDGMDPEQAITLVSRQGNLALAMAKMGGTG
jgi:hypothetical protein